MLVGEVSLFSSSARRHTSGTRTETLLELCTSARAAGKIEVGGRRENM